MVLPLRSGDPPEGDKTELFDAGVFSPQKELSNTPGSTLSGDISLYECYGLEISEWAQIREVLRLTRDTPKPYFCKVTGLGVLYVGETGWEIR